MGANTLQIELFLIKKLDLRVKNWALIVDELCPNKLQTALINWKVFFFI